MTTKRWLLLLICLWASCDALRADGTDNQSAVKKWQLSRVGKLGPFLNDPYLVVPLAIPSETRTHQAVVEASLGAFVPDAGPGNHVQILQDGRYVLYGDLFKTGEHYALVELPVEREEDPGWDGGRVAFAQQVGNRWQLRGLWNVAADWRAKDAVEDDHFPITPAEAPFELRDFDGDGVPEVIMAGEVWRYYQVFYLLRFDPHTRTLQLLASAMDKPEPCGGYARLYYNSGHRAIFEEWMFAKLAGGKLAETASWHEGAPYNPGDDEGLRATVLNPRGCPEDFRIDTPEEGLAGASIYHIKGRGMNAATVRFRWGKTSALSPAEQGTQEAMWLFHRLAGLPPEWVARHGQAKSLPPLRHVSVTVTGNPAFVRRLRSVGARQIRPARQDGRLGADHAASGDPS